MSDAYELLRAKERELALVRKEIAALRMVATLLSETNGAEASQTNEDHGRDGTPFDSQASNHNTEQDEPLQDSIRLLFQSSSPKRGRFRDWLDRVVGE
jgi:hypothetical protein